MIAFRDYQHKGKRLIQERWAQGDKRVMLWAMTGSGKGLWMSDFNRDAIDRGSPTLNVMRRREIIFQTIRNYKKYHDLNASPIMGNLSGIDLNNVCQVASIDTLKTRIHDTKYACLKDFPFVLIDECHDLVSDSYKRLLWFLEGHVPADYDARRFEDAKNYFKKYYIGLTATPFRVGKRTHTFFQSVVKPIEAHELRDQGYLVDAKVYGFKRIDTQGLRIDSKTGDFDQKAVFERVSKLEVIGDVVETYKKYGENRPAICFCVNQQHSKIMTEAFRRAGVPAIHCDADHSQKEREHALAGLKSGLYKVLNNCMIFGTGLDAPWIEVMIGARPSDSENLVVQHWGRVLRPFKICAHCKTELGGDPFCYRCGSNYFSYVKSNALLFDHGNNTSRFGLPYDIRHPELEPIDTIKKRNFRGIGVKTCPKCFFIMAANNFKCLCGFDFTLKNNMEAVIQINGEIQVIDEVTLKERLYQRIKKRYNSYKRLEMIHHWGPNAKYYKLYQDFGEELFEFRIEFGISTHLQLKLQTETLNKGIKGFLDNVIEDNGKVFS